ncbi:uncharacterized protein LOC26526519 [Drosophila erecta]|uniref:Uncharacterized protein n=1 Tax=Drosophila erecta TaxID=7220 RepID=A0A0Q5UHZ6_DROER|nr:uncharacterized protein LOC26526519 [Drosophila erecta]KQS43510.1 uncharacterized protein Dere_GG26695 [Drosophila erecta]
MIWIWSLITLGIVVGATGGVFINSRTESSIAPSTTTTKPTSLAESKNMQTTVDPFTALDNKITNDLQNILSKYERECMGNSEFTENIDLVRKAAKWSKERLEDKLDARKDFNIYNEKRISLEQQIDERIEALNNILPTQQPNSRCSKFYLKQRETLKNSKQLSNKGKISALHNNTEICKSKDNDDYDYYYDYNY